MDIQRHRSYSPNRESSACRGPRKRSAGDMLSYLNEGAAMLKRKKLGDHSVTQLTPTNRVIYQQQVADFCRHLYESTLLYPTACSISDFNKIPREHIQEYTSLCHEELEKTITFRKRELKNLLSRVRVQKVAFTDLPQWFQRKVILNEQEITVERMVLTELSRQDKVPGILDSICSGVQRAYQQEDLLAAKVASHPAFQTFPRKHLWRLFIDEKDQPTKGKFGYDGEPGYLAGCYSGFLFSMSLVNGSVKVDADKLCEIHDETIRDCYFFNQITMELKKQEKGFRTKDDLYPEYQKLGLFVAKGLETSASTEGVAEIERDSTQIEDNLFQHNYYLYKYSRNTGGEVPLKIEYGHLSYNSDVRNVINELLVNCYKVIDSKGSQGIEKEQAIAECVANLERIHIFPDGNCRTLAFMLTNILRLQAGLTPMIWCNPNALDGFSIKELVRMQQQGSWQFLFYCKEGMAAAPRQ